MNIESEEEKDLVCEYFNPTSKLTIYNYRIIARALLNAYLAQVKKYSIYGEQLEPAGRFRAPLQIVIYLSV